MSPLLDIRSVTKRFGGLVALDKVSFGIESASILGLVGPNGSGKSTLLNLLSGVYATDEGEAWLDGARIDGRPPNRIAAAGLARTFQNLQIFSGLSIEENVLIGSDHRQRASVIGALFASPLHRREEAGARSGAAELLTRVGLDGLGPFPPSRLSYGQRRLLEIARSLAGGPRLLMLDEPCAGLSQVEAESLAALVRVLAEGGMSVIVVEHNMRFVMSLVHRIVVLNFGRKIADGTPREVREDKGVVEAYLGRAGHARG